MRFHKIAKLVTIASIVAAALVLMGEKPMTTDERVTRLEESMRTLHTRMLAMARMSSMAMSTGATGTTSGVAEGSPGVPDRTFDPITFDPCPDLTAAENVLKAAESSLSAEEFDKLSDHVAIIEALGNLIDDEVKSEREAGHDTSAVAASTVCSVAGAELSALETAVAEFSLTIPH